MNYIGLRKVQSYDDIIDYLEHPQDIINYPNIIATQIINVYISNDEYEQLKPRYT